MADSTTNPPPSNLINWSAENFRGFADDCVRNDRPYTADVIVELLRRVTASEANAIGAHRAEVEELWECLEHLGDAAPISVSVLVKRMRGRPQRRRGGIMSESSATGVKAFDPQDPEAMLDALLDVAARVSALEDGRSRTSGEDAEPTGKLCRVVCDPEPREYFAGISDKSEPERLIWTDDDADAAELPRAVAEYIAGATNTRVEVIS